MNNHNCISDLDHNWYVLNTLTGKEESIKKYLDYYLKDDIKIKIPKKKMPERVQGKYYERIKILFPGYLFILIPKNQEAENCLATIEELKLKSLGIIKLLSDFEKHSPSPLTHSEKEMLISLLNTEDIADYTIGLKVGDEVTLIAGPFKDQLSKIVNINLRKFRITVELNFIGHLTVDFPFTYIEKI